MTDRAVARALWPKYMLCGALVPFGKKEVNARYEQEVWGHAIGWAGMSNAIRNDDVTERTDVILC